MAYEKMNKAAIAQMAEQYDKDTTPKKPGFWLNLFSYLGSGSNTVTTASENDEMKETLVPYNVSEYNLGAYAEHSPNFNPYNASSFNDWD